MRTTTQTTPDTWLPALDGVVSRLRSGALVADIHCGDGRSTVAMAQAFPRSAFSGYDPDVAMIAAARTLAFDGRNVRFEVAAATAIPEYAYDLVTTLDVWRPPTAELARHIRRAIAEDGTWVVGLAADADVAAILTILDDAQFSSVRLVHETEDELLLEVRP